MGKEVQMETSLVGPGDTLDLILSVMRGHGRI